ncbi:LysR family transcriptional regulator [Halomonas denitrificans]|uniref:LysR family transcriptional regulator n=1 Tax=Halomonas TaxID=2745 RepID=UPI001A8F0439|nr:MULTISPECIES: LysR family transcriptional regulator [Halomonas]MED5296479.1 LysR family transcriptional regulator [Pseudomonadota bacterium]MBN8412454.1 LysR family transcriptional regulator [Halomonas litopenaei]MBY5929535.1 LysR family transcriptional regulator [Halomonas sp. DP8Y7-3]MBY5968690.1 LysR family transcriptional regulator [Halomonas denitrificans]MBY5983932.1 LysR family transcriptional regulator [Halomonas sp. DP5Y7-2]
MDIPHQRLVYFQVTIEAGSVRQAAARLDIAPSAVSRQLSLIEDALGAPLLERSRQGVVPTAVGEMLLDYCRRRSALDDTFSEQLDAYQRLETGHLSLTVGEGFVGDLLDTPLRTFTERYRGVRLDVNTGSTSEIIEAVIQDEAHLGLMYHERVHPQLRFWHSSQQPLVALVSPSHPLAGAREALTIATLSDHPMALWRTGHGVRQLVDEGFREAGLRPQVNMQTNSLSVLLHAARSDLTLTLLPAFAAARELEDGRLVALEVDSERFRQARAHIVTRVGRRMPRAGLQLLRHLERWMRAFSSRVP